MYRNALLGFGGRERPWWTNGMSQGIPFEGMPQGPKGIPWWMNQGGIQPQIPQVIPAGGFAFEGNMKKPKNALTSMYRQPDYMRGIY